MRKYQPSNGTEGDIFMSEFCFKCVKMPKSPEAENQCEIFYRTQCYSVEDKEYPEQWRYEHGKPVCSAFKDRDEYNAERRARKRNLIASTTPDLFS